MIRRWLAWSWLGVLFARQVLINSFRALAGYSGLPRYRDNYKP